MYRYWKQAGELLVIYELNKERPAALVTGGSRGIGRVVAETLAREGFQILLTYVSRSEDAEKTVESIVAAGGAAKAFALEVSDYQAVKDLFDTEIHNRLNLAVLVNNAGITRDGLLLRMKDEAFDRVIDVNLKGAFACLREAAKIMTRRREGRIINITSVVGQMGLSGQVNYSASKAGLIGLTKSAARELASRNITVNAVAPGFIETDMTAQLDEKTRDAYLAQIPLRRFGIAQDVAETVAFLASGRAAYITGQVIAVNGGLYM